MTRISVVMLVAVSAILTPLASAQETGATDPPQGEATQSVAPAEPADASQIPPQWTYERQMQNPQGTVTNTHQYLEAPDDGRYVRQHVVNNPRGEMTQTWERVNTEEGYVYRRVQTWTNPDGVVLRQHERTMSGSDPYNYTRQHSITLPDGRTINQTQVRSWDGTSGTMERSFTGPNGQNRQWQRSWTPDEPTSGQVTSMTGPAQRSAISPATAPPPSRSTEKARWWHKLNPFGKKTGSLNAGPAVASRSRRGFTIGTPSANSVRASSVRPGKQLTARASQNTHRPSWAGGPARSIRPQGPPPNANSHSTATRPGRGRGRNR